ncbi:MAG: hypothetical protein ABL895_15080, partial [Cyclobacteriaceae bacterium]
MKNKSNPHPKQKLTATTKSKRPWLIPGVVILAAGIGVFFWMNRDVSKLFKSTSTPPSQAQTKTDQNQLVGRWVRTDSEGNYIIEIKSVATDGKLDASYFNPNPIKVGRAEWQLKNGSLMIVVELRDVNYPGST